MSTVPHPAWATALWSGRSLKQRQQGSTAARRLARFVALLTGVCVLAPAAAGFIVGYRRAAQEHAQLCRALL